MKPKLVIFGAAGRMGRRITALAAEEGVFEIFGGVDAPDHPDLGKDAGLVAGIAALGTDIADSPPAAADIVIDFSLPNAAAATIDYCLANNSALVMGTTGLTEDHKTRIASASETLPIVYATNMSVGMNVLFAIVGKIAQMLGDDYDIEIIEHHHRFKKDAPSGTAMTLAENISKATDRSFPACLTHGRSGKDALRQKGTIGMHAVRAGDITGIHAVEYSTLGETVTLHHTAHSRDTFVRGALRAAKWLTTKSPGLYNMADVLGINT